MKALIIALMKFLVVCWIWQRLEIKFYGSIQVREVDNYIAFILFLLYFEGRAGMSKKYTEIHVLKDRLREAGIPYEVQKANDGWQVGIPHLYPEESRDQA